MSDTTRVRLVYVFPDGQRSDLALGEIDRMGMLTTDQIAPDQEENVARIVEELNAQDFMFETQFAQVPDSDRAKTVNVAVDRGATGFLDALKKTALQTYGIDLVFDASAFDDDPTGLNWPKPAPQDDPIKTPGYGTPDDT